MAVFVLECALLKIMFTLGQSERMIIFAYGTPILRILLTSIPDLFQGKCQQADIID